MILETFRGRDLGSTCAAARRALGEDVMILRTEVRRVDGVPLVEIVVASAEAVESFRAALAGRPLPVARGPRPFTLALVGPTGAGKTTTLAKLALSPHAFGGRRVGVMTLDTFRVGALEQLSTLTEIAGLPLEVIYHRDEVAGALRRLDACDVILIDTPGRSPARIDESDEPAAILAAIRPAEVHLVVPVSMRTELMQPVAQQAIAAPTHLLVTKLDEVTGDVGLAELAQSAARPSRWVTCGQEVPTDLGRAPERIVGALGNEAPHAARGVA